MRLIFQQFMKQGFGWLLLFWVAFHGVNVYAQGTTATGTSNGVICSSAVNGNVPASVTFSVQNGSNHFVASAAKNSVSNPIVLATLQVNLTGCTLTSPGNTNQVLQFIFPAPADKGVALRSPLTGISAQVIGSPSVNLSGSGTGCSSNTNTFISIDSDNLSYMNFYPLNYTGSPTVFAGCNVTLNYVMAFYTNSAFSQSTATGAMTTALFNVVNMSTSNYAGDIGWGRVQTTTQNSANAYSYQFTGSGFNVSVESCTPSVSISGSNNATVTLPTVSSNQLNGAGMTAGATPFTISLSGCVNTGSNYSATAYWSYTAFSSSYPNVMTNSASSNPASGVGVQIAETTSGTPVLANNALGATTWTISNSSHTAPAQTFNAYYYSTGTTNLTGNVTGVANYTMSYN